jgi:hypothetical protein
MIAFQNIDLFFLTSAIVVGPIGVSATEGCSDFPFLFRNVSRAAHLSGGLGTHLCLGSSLGVIEALF